MSERAVLREVKLAEGLIKRVFREGDPETGSPPARSKVSVHYVGTLLDGSEFDSSRSRNSPFEFTIAMGQVIKGWDLGVASMHIGELAELECAPDYAYGARGSPPKIPPNSTLKFEVELLSFNDKDNVTDDGKVRKKKFIDGDGFDNPGFGGTAHVKIIGRVNDKKGPIFVDKEIKELVLDDPIICYGLELGLNKMLKGEHSEFWIDAEYGMGPKGIPDLKIPVNASLYYDVELISFHKPKDFYDMNITQKIAAGTALKDSGNRKFGLRMFKWALKKYEDAIAGLDSLSEAKGEEKTTLTNLKSALYRNTAACHVRLKSYSSAIQQCNEALDIDAKDTKALFRRGQASYFSGELQNAKRDLVACKRLCPADAMVAQYLKAVKKKLRKIAKQERALYGNVFG